MQYYPQAKKVLEQTLEQKAITKIALNQKLVSEVKQEIEQYNQSVNELNSCLRSLDLSNYDLPVIEVIEKTHVSIENNNHYQKIGAVVIE